MRARAQLRWAIIHPTGQIHTGHMAYSRRGAIEGVIALHRKFSMPAYNGTGLTDAQFWRQIKRRRGFTVRRISLRVVS